MQEMAILGTEIEFDDQFEVTALVFAEYEEDEVTEIIDMEQSMSNGDSSASSRVSFMSSLFRNL